MSGVLAKCLGDLRRHRLQAGAVALILFLASATGMIALSLMGQSADPFDQAFAAQRGAHLMAWFDPTRVSAGQLPATTAEIGATASAGPFPTGSVELASGTEKYSLDLVGQPSPEGAVGQLRVFSGRWSEGPGEIVVTRSFAQLNGVGVGARLRVVSLPQTPWVTVSGEVIDIDEGPADSVLQTTAWVSPGAFQTLNGPGNSASYLMLYRFRGSPSQARLDGAVTALRQDLPGGALSSTTTYLQTRTIYQLTGSFVAIALLGFSIFAVAVAALVVVNVVAGTVLASYREIGVMKAVGFTPRQTVAVYVLEMLVPAFFGCLVGIPAGVLLSQPLVSGTAGAVGLAAQFSWPAGTAAIALASLLLIVGLASLLPALRAGRLRPAEAIRRGTGPARGRSSRLATVAGWLRLPRPMTLGSRDAFARPLRGLFTVIAIVAGVATAVYAVGLEVQMGWETGALGGTAAVAVTRTDAYSDAQTSALLSGEPGTAVVVAEADTDLTVPGIAEPVSTTAFRGDSARLSYPMVTGRWFSAPGEAVAPKAIFDATHVRIGQVLTVWDGGTPVRLTMVGEVFSVVGFGQALFTDWPTLAPVSPGLQPFTYAVVLRSGVRPAAYAGAVESVQPEFLSVSTGTQFALLNTLGGVGWMLAFILLAVAATATFSAMLLTVRERRHDLATLKALGMTPYQLVAMVATTAALLGLIGGVIGIPAGLAMTRVLGSAMASQAGNDLPPAATNAVGAWMMPLFLLGGMAVAILGSLLAARSAARTSVATVLHGE